MIKVNSKVIVKGLYEKSIYGLIQPPTMIVEGLYHKNQFGIWNIKDVEAGTVEPEYAKCVWYNTQNELQKELIRLKILTEL